METVGGRGGGGRARAGAALLGAAVVVLAAACGAGPAVSVAAPSPAVLRAPDAAAQEAPAAPEGRPVVTVTGRIGATNGDGVLRLDQAALDRFGLLALTVDDPWATQRTTLQGFLLRDLVDLARPAPGATTVHLVALDDYQVDLLLTDVRAEDVYLATRTAEGTPLQVEDGGPTRVVFADDLAHRFSKDLWIWNIETIEVR